MSTDSPIGGLPKYEPPPCELFKNHIDMWKHYNTLRQGKTGAFLTANSILIAIAGFLMKEGRLEPRIVPLILLISFVGIVTCGSWFLLLSRNSAYIEYHRTEAGGGEKLWTPPKAGRIKSKALDSIPSLAFLVFWFGMLVFVLR